MKIAFPRRSAPQPIDPRYLFGIAWVAAFVSLALILAAVFWAIVAFA